MTITDTDPVVVRPGDLPESFEPFFAELDVDLLVAHPDNPRVHVGDVAELARSIKSKGVLENLTVTPGEDGKWWIAAGKRRHLAAVKADLNTVPAIIKRLSTVEVIEMGLVENGHRADLTLAEDLAAIEHLMSLDGGLTPAKLSKRIGRSQTWVRQRMAVTILPLRWRKALDAGELSLAAGVAAAGAADLGPDHLGALCERLIGWRGQQPDQVVERYREELRRAQEYQAAVAKERDKHTVVFTSDEPPPDKAKRLGELFDPAGEKVHRSEPCHAVVVKRRTWGEGVDRYEVCTEPKRHSTKRVGTASGSELASDRPPASGGGDDSHAKRKGRVSRQAHAVEVFGRARGGFSQTDLTTIALRGLIYEAGYEALNYAGTMLGFDQPTGVTAHELVAWVDTPAALVRAAGAVAFGSAECRMYQAPSSARCRAYVEALTRTGWEADEWTAARLDQASDPAAPDEDDEGDADDGDVDDSDGDDGEAAGDE